MIPAACLLAMCVESGDCQHKWERQLVSVGCRRCGQEYPGDLADALADLRRTRAALRILVEAIAGFDCSDGSPLAAYLVDKLEAAAKASEEA